MKRSEMKHDSPHVAQFGVFIWVFGVRRRQSLEFRKSVRYIASSQHYLLCLQWYLLCFLLPNPFNYSNPPSAVFTPTTVRNSKYGKH